MLINNLISIFSDILIHLFELIMNIIPVGFILHILNFFNIQILESNFLVNFVFAIVTTIIVGKIILDKVFTIIQNNKSFFTTFFGMLVGLVSVNKFFSGFKTLITQKGIIIFFTVGLLLILYTTNYKGVITLEDMLTKVVSNNEMKYKNTIGKDNINIKKEKYSKQERDYVFKRVQNILNSYIGVDNSYKENIELFSQKIHNKFVDLNNDNLLEEVDQRLCKIAKGYDTKISLQNCKNYDKDEYMSESEIKTHKQELKKLIENNKSNFDHMDSSVVSNLNDDKKLSENEWSEIKRHTCNLYGYFGGTLPLKECEGLYVNGITEIDFRNSQKTLLSYVNDSSKREYIMNQFDLIEDIMKTDGDLNNKGQNSDVDKNYIVKQLNNLKDYLINSTDNKEIKKTIKNRLYDKICYIGGYFGVKDKIDISCENYPYSMEYNKGNLKRVENKILKSIGSKNSNSENYSKYKEVFNSINNIHNNLINRELQGYGKEAKNVTKKFMDFYNEKKEFTMMDNITGDVSNNEDFLNEYMKEKKNVLNFFYLITFQNTNDIKLNEKHYLLFFPIEPISSNFIINLVYYTFLFIIISLIWIVIITVFPIFDVVISWKTQKMKIEPKDFIGFFIRTIFGVLIMVLLFSF